MDMIEKIYKDSEMSIYTLQDTLKKLEGKDNKITTLIQKIEEEYHNYLEECKAILENNNVPVQSSGVFAKMGADMGIMKEVMMDNSDSSIADMLIKGITMGILDLEKMVENKKESVDKGTLKMAHRFIKFQKEKVEEVKKFL